MGPPCPLLALSRPGALLAVAWLCADVLKLTALLLSSPHSDASLLKRLPSNSFFRTPLSLSQGHRTPLFGLIFYCTRGASLLRPLPFCACENGMSSRGSPLFLTISPSLEQTWHLVSTWMHDPGRASQTNMTRHCVILNFTFKCVGCGYYH